MIQFEVRLRDGTASGVKIPLEDSTGTSVTPNTFNWVLVDKDGKAFNSRTAETETPGDPTLVGLTKDDTHVSGHKEVKRYLKFWGEYDDAELGTGVQYTGQVELTIEGYYDHKGL